MSCSSSEIEHRLARAERRIALMCGVTLAAVVLAITTFGTRAAETQGRTTVVTAPFRVVDGRGRTLMEVTSAERGPSLRLFAASGKPVAEISTRGNNGAVTLHNADSKRVAFLGSDPYGGGQLLIENEAGQRAINLLGHSHGGAIELSNELGKQTAVFQSQLGGSALSLMNREGNITSSLDSSDEGGGMQIRRQDGREVSLFIRTDGSHLTMRDRADVGGAGMSAGVEGGRLDLYRGAASPKSKGASLRVSSDGGIMELFGPNGQPILTQPSPRPVP